MKRNLIVLFILLLSPVFCYAVPITLFMDTDTFIERAQDIIIAKCLSIPEGDPERYINGLHPVEVKVLMVLKGEKRVDNLTIVTIYSMERGTTYMLTSLGGSAYGTDFLALSELSVVPISSDFAIERLNGKSTKDQVQSVFSRRLFDVEQELEPLQERESLLERALRDRKDNLYESGNSVNIKTTYEAATTEENGIVYIDFKTAKLEWSPNEPGKSGYFYFTEVGSNKPRWEFSPTTYKKIDEFDGKPLRARFYDKYSPGGKKAFGQRDFHSIHVNVGEVTLARTTDDPSTIYIIKVQSQDEKLERMIMKYAIIGD